MQSLLFVKTASSTFVLKDQDILARHFNLKIFNFNQARGLKFIIRAIQFFFFYIYQGRQIPYTLIWFADFHAFAPVLLTKIFGNKSFVILGGSDVNSVTEINYGVDKTRLKRKVVRFIMKNANWLLPVDQSLAIKVIADYGKEISKKVKVLPTGYDPNKWEITSDARNQIITVASFNTTERALVKGLDRFVELASILPEFNFTIVGAGENYENCLARIPSNLKILGMLTPKELKQEYNKSKIYLQLSRSEGLPNAVCEAMLCGCYPICTDVGGMKNLVENYGFVMTEYDRNKLASEVRSIWNNLNDSDISKLRRHIAENYSEEKRENELVEVLR